MGTWMTRLATSWLVYRLTGSAFLLGVVGFAGQIPTFLFAPFAGVWVDRLNRRNVLLVTQALAMLQSFALAALALSHHINIHEIIWLSAFQGTINAFDMPGRQAFLVEMVEDKQDLGNAIALNSSMVNMARLVGPSLAGVVIAISSEGYCFLIDGISYLAVIASLYAMRLHGIAIKRTADSVLMQLKDGLDVRFRLRADSHHLAAFRSGKFAWLALHRVDARFCGNDPSWRSAYFGVSDGGGRSWRTDFSDFSRGEKNGSRARQNDTDFDRGLRRRPHPVRDVANSVAFSSDDARVWIRINATNGRKQHDHPNHRRGK